MMKKEGECVLENETLFALDIGTRSVVGVLLSKEGTGYVVKDWYVKEHEERAMVDGQIHDIPAVSRVIEIVTQHLSDKHGPLSSVCVAAAGRALKTETASKEITLSGKKSLTRQDVLHFEMEAVQEAQKRVADRYDEVSKHYLCVGYSVLHYELDGDEIGSLLDQRGDIAKVSVIATFLPRVVVDSLTAALDRCHLQMEALTLEPIAAIQVLIPTSMRRLNVALVDIGAGTSDIAITNGGAVVAYGMVPVAGDEMTERFSDAFLLDFPEAEAQKRRLSTEDELTFTDILGVETTVAKEDILLELQPAVDHLASAIAKEIISLNQQRSPKAVMLVGGGSLTPNLKDSLAEKLSLPKQRVAVRDTSAIADLTLPEQFPKGPAFVTPIGIAIASHQSPVQYVSVTVNEQPVRLFELRKQTVADCLLASGLSFSKLHGKPGMGLFVTVNGIATTLPGGFGEPPYLTKNGQPCQYDDVVQNGDILVAVPGEAGKSAVRTIRDLLPSETQSFRVRWQGKWETIEPVVKQNGRFTNLEAPLQDRDEIEIQYLESVRDLCGKFKQEDYLAQCQPFHCTIDERDTYLPGVNRQVTVNGKVATLDTTIKEGDDVEFTSYSPVTVKRLAERKQWTLAIGISVMFQGKQIRIEEATLEVWRDGERLGKDEEIHHGDRLRTKVLQAETCTFLFQDVFRYVDIDIPQQGGKTFQLLQNGAKATFTSVLADGDVLEIQWTPKLPLRNM